MLSQSAEFGSQIATFTRSVPWKHRTWRSPIEPTPMISARGRLLMLPPREQALQPNFALAKRFGESASGA
jgi:hypothetical protein